MSSAIAIKGDCDILRFLQYLELLPLNKGSFLWNDLVAEFLSRCWIVVGIKDMHEFLPLRRIKDVWHQTAHAD